MEVPRDRELFALSGILDEPILKELLRSIFAEQQVACIKYCQEHALKAEHHEATIEAAMAEAFGRVAGILQEFVDKYRNPEEDEDAPEFPLDHIEHTNS